MGNRSKSDVANIIMVPIPTGIALNIAELPDLNHAHNTNIIVRINGEDVWFGIDWLKSIQKAIRESLEFNQELKYNIWIGQCQNCGNILRGGRRGRDHCTMEENADCRRAYNAKRQRKSRAERRGKRYQAESFGYSSETGKIGPLPNDSAGGNKR